MTTFDDVKIIKAANIYFDGKVTSREVNFKDGTTKTLGIMMPGKFEFSTVKHELMEIMAGELDVLLPGNKAWQTIKAGEAFEVPSEAIFKLNVKSIVDYCCSYS